MFKKTCLYGVAALALTLAAPAHAQTTPPTEKVSAEALIDPDSVAGVLSDTPEFSVITTPPADSNKPRWYDENGNPFSDKYFESEPGAVSLALQRDPNLPSGHFVLFMSATQSFANCMKIINPKHSTAFDESGTMTVKMEKFIVDARDMPRYAHYECDTTPKQATVRVNLSKELLLDNGVKKIKFKAGKSTERYQVKITNDYIQLTPETRRDPKDIANRFRPLEVGGVSNTLKLWFYPENTVILSADGASKDITLENRLNDLARSKGLTPLSDIIPEHVHFRKKPDYFYFVDKQGRYKAGNGELFDYIQADTMKFGLEADEPAKKNIAVFMRRPGQYD